MLTNFADNYFLNDYISTVYNKYLLQSPAVLFNYYCVTKLSKYTSNYSAYKQYSDNTFYDCLLLTEGFYSTNVTQRTQTGETNVPFYSSDQIDIVIPSHIFTPTVGDKLSFSTDIPTLLARNNSRIFEVTQIEFPTPFTQTRNVCKVTCFLSTNANEETLQKYTLMNYAYLPFSKKYCKLEHYITVLNIIEQVKRIVQFLNTRYSHGFLLESTNTCILEPSLIFTHFMNITNCDPDSIVGILRAINVNIVFYKPYTLQSTSNDKIVFDSLTPNYDLIRKHPFVSKYNYIIHPSFGSSSNISNYVSANTLQVFDIVKQVNTYNDKNNQLAVSIISAISNTDLNTKSVIETLLYLVILLKLEKVLLYDYSRWNC